MWGHCKYVNFPFREFSVGCYFQEGQCGQGLANVGLERIELILIAEEMVGNRFSVRVGKETRPH